jgi:DNA-binding transcriptional MerR regulator
MYENSLKEVKELVEERPSREEDVEQINMLKDLLNNKEKEFQKVMEEAKCYKLELNNKEETFNRIFTASSNPLNIERIKKK